MLEIKKYSIIDYFFYCYLINKLVEDRFQLVMQLKMTIKLRAMQELAL